MTKAKLNVKALYAALDAERLERRLTWKQVAGEAGVHASTLTRMAQEKRPDADGLAALLAWLNLDIKHFTTTTGAANKHQQPNSLALISAYLRADPNLSEASADALEKLVRASYEHLKRDR